MKKLVFLLPVAALAIASCSSDSIVDQPETKVISSEALQIYPEIQGITRGTVWDNTNFAEFSLTTSGSFQTNGTTANTGTQTQFNATKVTKTGGVWKIEGADIWYWPSKSATSSFTAWAPTSVTAGNYEASATDISSQKDIVVAYNTGSATDFESGVPLKFRHILSQIVVKADNAAKSKIQIKVKGIRLNNISSTGKWVLPTASTVSALANPWSNIGTAANYTTSLASEVTLTDGSATDITGPNPLLLIPQQLNTADIAATSGQYLSVLVQIVNATDNTQLIYPKNNTATSAYAWAAVDVNTLWEPGKKYIYTLHFTENGYGKIDGNTTGGNDDPGDPTPIDDTDDDDDPKPGDDVVDAPVKLVLDVEVIDWTDVTEEQNM